MLCLLDLFPYDELLSQGAFLLIVNESKVTVHYSIYLFGFSRYTKDFGAHRLKKGGRAPWKLRSPAS